MFRTLNHLQSPGLVVFVAFQDFLQDKRRHDAWLEYRGIGAVGMAPRPAHPTQAMWPPIMTDTETFSQTSKVLHSFSLHLSVVLDDPLGKPPASATKTQSVQLRRCLTRKSLILLGNCGGSGVLFGSETKFRGRDSATYQCVQRETLENRSP